jgi:hypothetical protein
VKALSFLEKPGRTLGDAALKWTLAFPDVSVTIPGIRNPRQARLNLASGEGPILDSREVKRTRVLYASNFGFPRLKRMSVEEAPAVFVSDAKIGKKQANKPAPKASPRRKAKKKARTKTKKRPVRRNSKTRRKGR